MSRAPRVLELFSGSGTFSKVARDLGMKTLTLDIDEAAEPDVLIDILDWNFKDKAWGTFDIIHSSVPCEELSICHTRSPRDIEGARKIANKTREIIDHFRKLNPKTLITIENPAKSLFLMTLPKLF